MTALHDRRLHIVSFDVPYPPDYGGAIDVFYKIKALKEAGAQIYLHCFAYGRQANRELEALCREVFYYPRITGLRGLSLTAPYIVHSRRNKLLLKRLMEIEAPILFEGVHTTHYLSDPGLKKRIKAVRTHNIESDYYEQLAIKEPTFTKRLYYKMESSLLGKYEHSLEDADCFFSLSSEDNKYFQNLYPQRNTSFIAPFHPYSRVMSFTGMGEYCLYHGNLSHPENKEAALYLLNKVFGQIDMEVIIAGREPGKEIFDACNSLSNCRLIANPSVHEMEQLIQDAHIHVLPTFQASGMKLKLLYALFCGRHVIANANMLHGTGLDNACIVANTTTQFVDSINDLRTTAFTANHVAQRATILAEGYDNNINAERILTYLQV
ncbi:MAG: glycosyltransferase [Flavipsychrobacter sp.]